MAKYSEEEKNILLSVRITEIMAYLGRSLEHDRSNLYLSPFREESKPSFHLEEDTNRWYDFGEAVGGGLLDFVCKIAGCSRGKALDWLAEFRQLVPQGSLPHVAPIKKAQSPASSSSGGSKIIIDSTSHSFKSRKLVEYAQSRAIPREVLERYCEEVHYHIASAPDKKYFAIGFKNNGGGYVLRSSLTKRCTSSEITTLGPDGEMSDKPQSSRAIIFEGFMDFLSWITKVEQATPQYDVCVLNSVANIKKALPWILSHSQIATFMDNDDAGRKTTSQILEEAEKSGQKITFYDMSSLYKNSNDLNDMLTGSES